MNGLVAAHGDGRGPGGTAAAAVGDDVEDGGVELGAAAVVWVEWGVSKGGMLGWVEGRGDCGDEGGLWEEKRSCFGGVRARLLLFEACGVV